MSRLIDADKLVEELISFSMNITGSHHHNFIVSQCKNSIKRIVDEQPTVCEWIPCSERLPEKTGYYLVQLSRKLPNEDYSDRVVVLYNGEDKEFMAYERLITAWQPLPEPYQPEGGEV